MIAHVGGLPIEETLGSFGPALLTAIGVAAARLRVRLHRDPAAEAHPKLVAEVPRGDVVSAAKEARVMRAPVAGAVLATAALLALAAPAAAPAAVTCDASSGVLTVALGAAEDGAILEVVAGEIRVKQVATPITCSGPGAPPTVTNTAAISVTGNADNQGVLISEAKNFVPGSLPEAGSNEIEIFVNLNDRPGSRLVVSTGNSSGLIVFGTSGINANAVGEAAPADADITGNVEQFGGLGGDGNDELDARGGRGTGSPLREEIILNGGQGTNHLQAGEGSDKLMAGDGNDTLFAGGGDDLLEPGEGNDTVSGGADTDLAVVDPNGPVTVDLGLGSGQDTGQGTDTFSGIENVNGGLAGPATLRGDDGPNVLVGTDSPDTLEGRGGQDVLVASDGADTLLARDGGPDRAECGADDADTVTADSPGIDLLTDCETTLFPSAPGGGTAGGGGDGAPVLAPTAAFGARTLVTLALAGRRIPAKGPLAVRVSNANDFDVSGRLSAQTTSLLSAAQRRRPTRLRAKAFTVAANARRTVRLRLPRTLRRRLVRRRKLSLLVTATVEDPAGNTRTVRKTLRPRLRRPARG